MRTRIEGRDGWVEVVRDGIHLLAKGDASLVERVEAAVAAAEDDDLADVVTDELSAGGVRRTPDFALVDESTARVLVRGTACVVVSDADGVSRTITAPTRGPWTDEDLTPGESEVVIGTGEPQPGQPVVEPGQAAGTRPEPTTDAAPESVAPAGGAPTGWVMPSVFDRSAGPAEPGAARPADATAEPQQPVEEGDVVETPAPEGQDLVAAEPEPEAPQTAAPDEAMTSPADHRASGDEYLPSFDFLFGNTDQPHGSLLAGVDEESQEQGAIDSGPVAAAGGFRAADHPAGATLAPPSEEDEAAPSEPSGPTVGDHSGGLPPMTGSAPFADADDAGVDAPAPAPAEPAVPAAAGGPPHVQAARDDATGREPGGGRPQFADGHLVGARVPRAGAAPAAPIAPTGPMVADSGPAPVAPESADQAGVISAVPWGEDAAASGPAPTVEPVGGPAPGPAPGMPGMPFGLPSLPTPDHADAPHPETPESEGESEGPMVLAVRCSHGHLSAPHATRCRVCGQDLPTQQPEQTVRPALGHLRMSTGDLVTLDRGVLVGRAPRSSETGPRAPHLVRISSPDNEISRNHVEIVLDGWHVLVRDLGSTNGTTVALPGSSPVRVRPGDQQTIEPGTTITLADQASMVFEVTG